MSFDVYTEQNKLGWEERGHGMQTSLSFVFLPLPTPNARGLSIRKATEENAIVTFDLQMRKSSLRQSVAGSAS